MSATDQSADEEGRLRRSLLANIRYALLAPVGGIVGYAEMLFDEATGQNLDEITPDLAKVLAAARQLYGMTDKLLATDAAQNLFHGEDPEAAQRKLRHDLRTPINGIKGFAELLLEDLDDLGGGELRPDFDKLLAEVNRLLPQLSQIVDFTRGGTVPSEAPANSAMVADVLRSIKPVVPEKLLPEEVGRILVVDDVEANRDLLARRLTRDGHRVETVASGRDALTRLSQESFDLILLDLMMPGMNGFEVLAKLKASQALQGIPVIMVSAFDETDSVIRCIEAGADDYLPKPVNPILLRARIKSGLEKKAWHDRERQQKQFIRQAFSRYISPEVVDQLIEDPDRLSLGGERLDITCVFTDLAGFTTLMEDADPAEVLPVLNAYLDGMCMLVREHGGTIDKIVGDALHVFFGAPVPMDNHPTRAVNCALAMDSYARNFETSEHARAIGFGGTRIGIHSGLAVVGNFGGETFFDYTAHGDTVNTAARMETVNTHIGSQICVSGVTVARCTEISFRPIGELLLKGKSQPVDAYEPIPALSADAREAYLEAYASLAKDPAVAQKSFVDFLGAYPGDLMGIFHLNRLRSGETGTVIRVE